VNDKTKWYRGACWVFFVAFVLVLLALALMPGQLVDLMNGIAGLFGLGGEITVGTADLDHVLALSLMGCITVLAGSSAARPKLWEPYAALMTAKFISTAGFGYLAFLHGGAWILPVLTDGAVIVGLMAARRMGGLSPLFPPPAAD
jgi:hypothetical protein